MKQLRRDIVEQIVSHGPQPVKSLMASPDVWQHICYVKHPSIKMGSALRALVSEGALSRTLHSNREYAYYIYHSPDLSKVVLW